MRRLWGLILALGVVCFAGGASAQIFNGCKTAQQETILSVIPEAEMMAARAAAAIGNTPEYVHWFGDYTDKYAEEVRSNFKVIHRALDLQELEFICGAERDTDCIDTYAFVYTTEHYVMTLCPNFFGMPRMAGGSPTDPEYENGTMEGTIIHEISHFDVVARTEDHCYSRSVCGDMADGSPQEAVENADTYQYFAEDITFAFVAAQTDGVVDDTQVIQELPGVIDSPAANTQVQISNPPAP